MTDYLAHHGIAGQKWGVRNGPPYPLSRQGGRGNGNSSLGNIRYGSTRSVVKNIERVRADSSQDHVTVRTKRLDEMTNEELQRVVNRLQLEQRYIDYVAPKEEKKTLLDKARQLISNSANDIKNVATIATSIVKISKAMKGETDDKKKKGD